ncbi:aminoglycoside phosphotransferase/kinase family protein [Jatrophihabitans fulvus]
MNHAFPDGPEIVLPAGDVTEGVVRIGDTVRRPHQDTSEQVAAYLAHLEHVGLDGVPRYLGRDHLGRDVLTFLDGDVPGDPVEPWAADDRVLPGVARLLRRLHDASEGFELPPVEPVPGRPQPVFPQGEPLLVTQRDVTPQNTVFRDGEAWGLVDFDLSNWTTRPTDLANTAMHWVPLTDPSDRHEVYDGIDVSARFRAMYDAYGRDRFDVDRLLAATRLRFAGSYDVMKWNADHLGGGWRRMWDEGLGDVLVRRLAWFDAVRDDLHAALA